MNDPNKKNYFTEQTIGPFQTCLLPSDLPRGLYVFIHNNSCKRVFEWWTFSKFIPKFYKQYDKVFNKNAYDLKML